RGNLLAVEFDRHQVKARSHITQSRREALAQSAVGCLWHFVRAATQPDGDCQFICWPVHGSCNFLLSASRARLSFDSTACSVASTMLAISAVVASSTYLRCSNSRYCGFSAASARCKVASRERGAPAANSAGSSAETIRARRALLRRNDMVLR